MAWAFIKDGKIIGLIAYNGIDPYTPPADVEFREVPDDKIVGDDA